MSRHRQPEDEAPAGAAVDPPTGPLTLPPEVAVPQPRAASEPVTPTEEVAEEASGTRHALTIVTARRSMIAPTAPAGPRSGLDGAPGAITRPTRDPITPRTGIALPAEVRREWADAPGSFARMGAEGPRTLPQAALPALPPRPAPPVVWGPWPPEPSMGPPLRRRGPSGRMVAAVAVLVVLLVVLLVGLGVGLVRPELVGLSAGSPFAASGEAAPGSGATSSPVASAPVDPTAELQRLARSDAAATAAVENAWVPQLSSKRPGTVASGRTYDTAAILAEHEQLRARHPGARLLWSGDWPVFGSDDYWVTVLAMPSSSAGGANSWCDRQGFGADDCFARWLARSGGSEGTAVHR
ncbi:hypothetical protein [Actinomycetospora chibensis]|uniref:Uncharacterized protein n=1 Tax=Actinomycetospora chibensis TaxID=663606 RepID=A0ABV9RGS8_9PSEU|nr:hypothetical protein [Actinomycetospora chibensis]MDD7922937.1 hypothetical protein [Actinomycetospora chibensis]